MHLYFPAQTESRALNLCNTATINSLAHFPLEQIEQTWGVDLVNRHNIRYGKPKGGLVGFTLFEEQVAQWVLSNNICNNNNNNNNKVFI